MHHVATGIQGGGAGALPWLRATALLRSRLFAERRGAAVRGPSPTESGEGKTGLTLKLQGAVPAAS